MKLTKNKCTTGGGRFEKTSLNIIVQGAFCSVYDEDAIIICHLLGYKMIFLDCGIKVSFPISACSKVETILQEMKVEFRTVSPRIVNTEYAPKGNRYKHILRVSCDNISIKQQLIICISKQLRRLPCLDLLAIIIGDTYE